jgi:hypothetical protein
MAVEVMRAIVLVVVCILMACIVSPYCYLATKKCT